MSIITENKEIKLTLQISKIISVNDQTSIRDIKRTAEQHFGIYSHDLSLFIKEYEITSLDSMNAVRTLDYYKSNTILVTAQQQRKDIRSKESKFTGDILNLSLQNESNKDILEVGSNRTNILDYKYTPNQIENKLQTEINKAYSNLNNLKSAVNNYSVNNGRTNAQSSNNNNNSMLNNSNLSDSMSNSKGFRISDYRDNSLKDTYSPVKHNYLSSKTFFSKKSDLNCNNYFNSNRTTKLSAEDENSKLREENEHVLLSNQILNKSNMDLKSQLQSIAEDIQSNKDLINKIQELNIVINNMKSNLSNCERVNNELMSINEVLQRSHTELVSENLNLKSQLSLQEKTNSDLKYGLNSIEDILKNYDKEKSIINLHLNEKDKQILELTDKIYLQEELNEKIKKSISDYEEMMNNMKKTIEILKKSSDECENEIFKLRCIIDEKDSLIESKSKEIVNKEKQISNLCEEINFIKNEINHYNNEMTNKDNNIDDLLLNNRQLTSELDKLKQRIDNLVTVLEDKDSTIQNMNAGYITLNNTLEEIKQENDLLKRKSGEDHIERNKNLKNKEITENLINELQKKTGEFNKLKDSFHKSLLSQDSELQEYKLKLNQSQFEVAQMQRNLAEKEEVIQNLRTAMNSLNEDKDDLSSNYSNSLGKCSNLAKEINESKNQINFLQNEISKLNSIIDKKEEHISSLSKAKEMLENANFELKDKLFNLEKDVLNLNDKNMKIVNEFQLTEMDFKKEITGVIEELKKKEKAIQVLNKKIEELTDLLRNGQESRDKMKSNFDNTLNEMKKTKELVNEKERIIMQEKIQLVELIEKKQKEIEEYKTIIGEKEETTAAIKSLNEQLEVKNKELLDTTNELENKVNNLNEKIGLIKQKHDENIQLSEEINKRYQDLVRQNTKANAENMLLKEKYEKLNNELLSLIKEKNSNTKIAVGTVSPSKFNSFKVKEKEWNQMGELENNEELMKIEPSIKLNIEKNEFPFVSNNKSLELDLTEGNKFLFRVYDSKRILRFDLKERIFKLIEFSDYGGFENNFAAEGSIYLNVLDGLYIITGDNHDMFYFYSNSKGCMNKLSKLNTNHSYGSLIFHEKNQSLICLSGWHNKKVEKYVTTKNKQVSFWSYLPELTIERSESSYVIINDRFLYAFFGYCCPKMKCLDSVELLDLDSSSPWQAVQYSNESRISTCLKSHSLLKLNDKEIIIIGGLDGMKESPVENLIYFNFESNSISQVEMKLPDIIYNHSYNFQKDSIFVPFMDKNKRLFYAGIDEMDNVHVIDVKSLQYDLFKFD